MIVDKKKENYDSLMLSNLRNSEMYRLEKMRADENLKKYQYEKKRADSNYESGKVLFFLFIISLVANFYFIFK